MDKGKEKEKECFSSDRLFSHKRNVENANIDVELRLGVPPNDPKKPKLLNVSSSVTNNVVHSAGKNLNEFQFTVIKIMTSYPMKYMMETEEEVRQRKEKVFLHRLKAKKKLQQRRKAARFAKENVNSSLPPSPGSQESVSSSESTSETQKLVAGASGSGTTTVRAIPSDASLKEMQKLIGDALVEARNEKAPAVTTTSGPKMCKGMFRNAMLSMPLVSTRCVGPNGKTTQGLLYEYKKGEEVKIVCVCHGYFLSAAEFIKHAGGGDVENPLRHIIIKPAANC